MRHINSAVSYSVLGSMGVVVMSALTGCEAPQQEQQNKFMVIQEKENGRYEIVEEHPTDGETRAILRGADGQERFLSNEELKRIAEEEYAKMQNGQSELNGAPSDEGLGLGGTILAAAAGALIGNMIANALMGNKNFQQHQQRTTKSAYTRSANKSTASKSGSTAQKRSFFGSSSKTSSSRTSSFGG
jgi:hypothetical protein